MQVSDFETQKLADPKTRSIEKLQTKPVPEPQHNIEEPAKARIEIFDLTGRALISLDQGEQNSGQHAFPTDLSAIASGIYFAVLEVNAGMGYRGKATFKFSILRP